MKQYNKYDMRPVCIALSLSTLFLFGPLLTCAKAQEAQSTDPVADATAAIVAGRDTVRGYVSDIKRQFKPDSAEYRQAQRKYRAALGKYNGWVAAVKRAIREGRTRDELPPNSLPA